MAAPTTVRSSTHRIVVVPTTTTIMSANDENDVVADSLAAPSAALRTAAISDDDDDDENHTKEFHPNSLSSNSSSRISASPRVQQKHPAVTHNNNNRSRSSSSSSHQNNNNKKPLGLYHPEWMVCGACTVTPCSAPTTSPLTSAATTKMSNNADEEESMDTTTPSEEYCYGKYIRNPQHHDERFDPRFVPMKALSTGTTMNPTSASLDDDNNHHPSDGTVRSTLHVQGMCCASELPAVQALLRPYAASPLHISLLAKRVYVHHYPESTSAEQLCHALTQAGFPARVVRDGAAVVTKSPTPTTSVSRTVLDDDDNNNNNDTTATATAPAASSWSLSSELPIHVILSGLFWILSLVGALSASSSYWNHLKYAGLLSVATGLPPVAVKAWRTLWYRRQLDANGMMVTAALGAVVLGEFDEAASVSFLFAISEYLEARASQRARVALQAIVELRPECAQLIVTHQKNGEEEEDFSDDNNNNTHHHYPHEEIVVVAAEQLAVGSRIRVRTGDKIAADGIVESGSSVVDQSSLTGESVPVPVTPGSVVAGGTINVGRSPLVVRTTATVQDSAVSRLIQLVEDAQANRSPTEKMVDGFARSYTPTVVGVAAVLATVPWLWGAEVGRYWTLNGLILIVIACPCALTISTPVTYAAGLAAAAQRGIVCQGGASLEALGSVQTVLLDKTGTLTQGNFALTALEVVESDHRHGHSTTTTTTTRQDVLALLAVMEGPSSHPLSSTLAQAAQRESVRIPKDLQVENHVILKGEGVAGRIRGQQVYVGNERLFVRLGMYAALPERYKALAQEWSIEQGGTVGFIGTEEKGIVGAYCVTDMVRPEARQVIETLQKKGKNVIMLTGDGRGAASAVARQVGLSESSAVHAQLLPEDKLHFVGSLKYPATQGRAFGLFRRQPRVLFCGDGVNDAPALTMADVGVSMGEGAAALATEMSDVTLMDADLTKLVYILDMGTRVLHTIRENILLSLFCKLAVVVLTFGGYMTLLYAIASDVGVMLLVTLNGMKLLPGSNAAVTLDGSPSPSTLRQNTRRWFAWKSYDRLDSSNGSSHQPANAAKLVSDDGEEKDDDDLELV